jgi:oligosaccharyltransferase complex subunit alpha (ribophorin I)
MASKTLFITLILLISISVNAIVNNKVTRTVGIKDAMVMQTVIIEFENDSDKDIDEYTVLIPYELKDNYVSHGAETSKGLLKTSSKFDIYEKGGRKYLTTQIKFDKPIAPGKDERFTLHESYVRRLNAFPATMKIKEVPKARVIDDAYYPSLYDTKKMKTTFELGEQFSVLKATEIDSGEVRGRSIRYGTYKDVPALKSQTVYIHLSHDNPNPLFTSVKRDITLSHWNSIKVEEEYRLINDVAVLAGEFGRLDFNPFGTKYALSNLNCELPLEATDLYYVDEIGNITTSKAYRDFGEGHVKFILEPRFPIVGGWKTYWRQGYNLPQESYIKKTGNPNEYEFEINFSHPFDGIVAEDFEFSVTFPEGAYDVRVNIDLNLDDNRNEKVFKYLDLKGRDKMIVSKKNVAEAFHNKPVKATYKLSEADHYMKPALLTFYIFIALFILQLISRCSTENKRSKAKIEQ